MLKKDKNNPVVVYVYLLYTAAIITAKLGEQPVERKHGCLSRLSRARVGARLDGVLKAISLKPEKNN